MIFKILSLLLFCVFLFLGGIHLFWLLGGKWGLKKAIPTKENSTINHKTPKVATLIVAIILFCFATAYLIKSKIFVIEFPEKLLNLTLWFIPSAFILRAIGEFNYVGFFKKIKNE